MSPNTGSSTAAWPPKRPSQRTKLRNGTFIVPRTGERSRQEFSLRTSTAPATTTSSQYRSLDLADTYRERLQIAAYNVKVAFIAAWAWLQTDEGHGVLKSTLTVYFHPARTVGSMLEAVVIAIIAVIYAEVVSLLSMGIAIVFRAQLGITAAAHALILIICIGGGLGFVGWVKQKLNNPLVNVGTTLCSIAIISVITKEESVHGGYFSDDKIVQVIKMLGVGITFTVAVNVLVWRISARHVLRKSIMKATISLGDKLSSITKGFLSGTEDELWSSEYSQVSAQYNSAYARMSSVLREAKFEHYFVGRESIYRLDRRLVRSIEGLSQAIGGLRSCLETQFTLLREIPSFGDHLGTLSSSSSMISPALTRGTSAFFDDYADRLAVIEESGESEEERRMKAINKSDSALDKVPVFQAPSEIFAIFIELLGPSIKSLVHTLSEILREPAFGKDPNADITVNEQLRESLRDALSLYNSARADSLQELYRIIELGRARSEKIQADIEEVAAACGHFSFSLQAVAEETDAYLDVLEDLKYTTETSSRSWQWLRFWHHLPSFREAKKFPLDDPETERLIPKPPVPRLRKSQVPKGIPDTMIKRRDTFNWDAAPQANKFKRAFSQKVLKVSRFFGSRGHSIRYQGEWGLLSFMIVAGMTTGAANTTGTARFKGTLVGAACAITSWTLSGGDPIALIFFGGIVALCNFYWILAVKNAPLGRIALLAYNVSTLYAYSLSQSVDDDDDDEGGADPMIFDIAFHRVVSVTLGILWGVIFCRLLWPISGRRKFREGLSVLYLQMGLIWKRGPLTVSLQSNNTVDYMREGEQAALQRYAFKLNSLRTSANSEFELRGPFPDASYARIMRSTKHILDGFYAMRLITQKRSTLSEGERALLEFTSSERIRLCERISHVFQVLASCIMLEYPLTDAIPTVENNKDRLLGKIYQFRKDHMEAELLGTGRVIAVEEKDYALLYAYTLVTLQVAAELNKVRNEIEGLFGVLHEESLLLQ
ncbi:hypothetical protein G7Z17_g12075 [Cylindrodendrum hubeiense]|uniref:Integral membrane bound transporter domain-containing protein n=1 Tax=Cylindrodendrum hubeiense TaxID=595255 RepID=A0A9P5GUR2_9HYPO|nr:hypothetical protein G7Z17_g12075 [Cylindrodendrum hubeiense]